jgi:hypothetical protein
MEATSVFFVVRSGNDIIPTVGESERCFLWGPFTGYIVQSYGDSYQLVSNGKGHHKSWLQSWIRSLQRKRIDSVVVSHKVYTL